MRSITVSSFPASDVTLFKQLLEDFKIKICFVEKIPNKVFLDFPKYKFASNFYSLRANKGLPTKMAGFRSSYAITFEEPI